MVIGRIKRLQSAARSQIESIKTDELSICNLCDRPIPSDLRDAHHLISKEVLIYSRQTFP